MLNFLNNSPLQLTGPPRYSFFQPEPSFLNNFKDSPNRRTSVFESIFSIFKLGTNIENYLYRNILYCQQNTAGVTKPLKNVRKYGKFKRGKNLLLNSLTLTRNLS